MIEKNPYNELEAGFGHAAERYDREVGTNPAMRYMRRISLKTLDAAFQPGQRVIEIGCGTGQEALHLAQRGVHVLATDLSQEMVDRTAQRAAQAGVENGVQTRRLAARDLGTLIEEYGQASFDGAYSSFGPLNGEPNLRAVSTLLAALVRPGGVVVASVMNRFCLFETAWFLVHGRPRQAVRRWKGRALAGVSPTLPDRVPTWYYTPRALVEAFAGAKDAAFCRVECRALPLLLPPPPFAHLWTRAPGLIHRLAGCEDRLARRAAACRAFCGLGDHFLMVLRRT